MIDVNERPTPNHTHQTLGTMVEDPRTKARSFLESTGIVSELEDVLNQLAYERPNDLHGFLANHFLKLTKPPQITALTLRRVIGPAGEPAVHIALTIAAKNKTEEHHGLTVHLPSTGKQLDALLGSTALRQALEQVDLFDQATIDHHLTEMAESLASEVDAANGEGESDGHLLKTPSNKRPIVSPALTKPSVAAPAPSKKGTNKDAPTIEIVADEPEPTFAPGQLLTTGISLTCRLIAANMQQSSLYRLLSQSAKTNLSLPLPIIPILQSGPTFPGKQALIKYFMLIPTPAKIRNDEWIDQVHRIIQFLRDSLATAKGATLQSGYSTDDGCLVFPMDRPEQGFDLLQNAVHHVCGSDDHCFDYAVQMDPYDTFDYTRGRYEWVAGAVKTADELLDVYTGWVDAYPRCVMLIDPFRHADKSSFSRLCGRLSHRCYITSTDPRRSRQTNDHADNPVNCHLLSFEGGPTVTEFIEQVTHSYPLGLFERDHQEVTQMYLADLAVALGCRFIKLPGILSTGGHRTAAILQRLAIIRAELDASAWPKEHEFIQIRSSLEPAGPAPPIHNKTKDKKKRT